MIDVVEKVLDFIQQNKLINSGDEVCAALSGGADSTALLLILLNLKEKLDFSLSAVHVNHNLRGEESVRDENFCRGLCERLGVKLTVESVDVLAYCKEKNLSTETGARELRYAAFEKTGADKIATAHNLNDSLETALFNLARGTALKGLCGVPVKRGNFIRPLLCVTRDEIENFLRAADQDWVTDSTNLTDDYSRNFIRHSVVPALCKINTRAIENFDNTSRALSADEEFLSACAKSSFDKCKTAGGYNAESVNALDKAIKNRVVKMILEENNVSVSAQKIAELTKTFETGEKFNLKDGIFSRSENGTVFLDGAKVPSWTDFSCNIEYDEPARFFNKTVKISKTNIVNTKFTKSEFDCDKIKGEFILRNRKSGDRVKFSGKSFTSDLKKLFSAKIPRTGRENTVIISDSEGIIFVEGFGIADRVKPDKKTHNTARVIISS